MAHMTEQESVMAALAAKALSQNAERAPERREEAQLQPLRAAVWGGRMPGKKYCFAFQEVRLA